MRKHILGFALFSLIVGFSIAVYSFLFAPHRASHIEVIDYPIPSQKFDKDLEIEKAESRLFSISRAALYPAQEEENINVELLMNCKRMGCSGLHFAIKLYFFTKDESGTNYLGAEEFIVAPRSSSREVYAANETINSIWLKKLKPSDNVYVTLEKKPYNLTEAVEDKPDTDVSLAKPVLLVWGKKK